VETSILIRVRVRAAYLSLVIVIMSLEAKYAEKLLHFFIRTSKF